MFRVLLTALLFSSGWLLAGWHYTAVTETVEEKAKNNTKMLVEAWIDGNKGKVLFTDTKGNPMLKDGNYLITTDGGATIYLVNPKDQNYMEWDMSMLMQMAGSMGNMVKMQIDNYVTEQLEKSEGDNILGYKTTRYKHQTSYDMVVKVMGMGSTTSTETISEAWVTNKFTDSAFDVWLRMGPTTTGNESLDTMIEEEMNKIKGFPLRVKTKTETKQWNKKRTKVRRKQTSHSSTQVTKLAKMSVPGSTFQIPSNYEKVDMLGGEGNPLKGIFGKKNKN